MNTNGTTSPGTDEPEDLHLLAGEYVLGTLDAVQRQSVQARLPREPALAAAVREWEARLLPLAVLAEPVPPQSALWQRIAGSVDALTRRATAARPGFWHQLWHSLMFWRGLAGAGVAAVLVMGSALMLRSMPPITPQYIVVLAAPQNQAPGWMVQARTDREVNLIPLAAFTVPPDKALEFWTKADDWQGPVSLGLVKPGEPVRIPLDRLPPLEANQLFELTLEPSTGSPTGKPTGPIQFIGRAVKVL